MIPGPIIHQKYQQHRKQAKEKKVGGKKGKKGIDDGPAELETKVEEAVENVGKRKGKERQVAFWSENDMNTMPQHLAHPKCSI
ncbi:hypothetical protein BT96DRAFT_929664, partial [Gymnopus androsaceus JB14]